MAASRGGLVVSKNSPRKWVANCPPEHAQEDFTLDIREETPIGYIRWEFETLLVVWQTPHETKEKTHETTDANRIRSET